MEKLICPVCGKSNYEIRKKLVHYFDNERISFDYYEVCYICNECKEELYSDELQKENQKRFEEVYKKHCDIITIDEIKEILSKYNISKRTLPYVLGIGEITITRYLDGYVPTKKMSDLLKSVLNNPLLYKEYLEKNKKYLSKNVYARTNNKVNSLLGLFNFDKKLETYANYIICNNPDTSNLVLNKLLYYCELFYRVFNNKKLFESPCGAWEHGPVYGQIYYEYKSFENNAISNEVFDDEIEIKEDEKALIDKIIEYFGIYSGKVLSFFTHEEDPWKEAIDSGSKFLDDDKITEYSKNIKNKYNINKLNDIANYSNYMFEKYKAKYMND